MLEGRYTRAPVGFEWWTPNAPNRLGQLIYVSSLFRGPSHSRSFTSRLSSLKSKNRLIYRAAARGCWNEKTSYFPHLVPVKHPQFYGSGSWYDFVHAWCSCGCLPQLHSLESSWKYHLFVQENGHPTSLQDYAIHVTMIVLGSVLFTSYIPNGQAFLSAAASRKRGRCSVALPKRPGHPSSSSVLGAQERSNTGRNEVRSAVEIGTPDH